MTIETMRQKPSTLLTRIMAGKNILNSFHFTDVTTFSILFIVLTHGYLKELDVNQDLWVYKIGVTAQIYAKENILIILANVDKRVTKIGRDTIFDPKNVLLTSKCRFDT